MQVQSALYNGHEIVKTNHAPAAAHDSEDTIELAEITRKRMLKKMKALSEVEQNVLDKKCAEIERKNLLIENENLIPDCLSNELLYSVMNSVNTVSGFSKMHDAYTVEQARTVEIEAAISNLKHKIQKDDHNERIKCFSKLVQPKHVSTSEIVITERFSNTSQKPLTRYKYRNKKEKAISTGIPTTAETQAIDASVKYTTIVVQIILWYLDSGCSKHMTRNRLWLKNFIKKFTKTVRFGNDHFGAIIGYGDYVIGDSVISGNGIVKRWNRTLVEAARTITPYELVHGKKLDLTFLRIFGALCYPPNESDDLGKLKAKANIRIFVGYAPNRKGYRIYNNRTQRMIEIIHIQFDELTEKMALVHLSTGPEPTLMTPGQISLGLIPNPVPAAPCISPTNKDLENLFQPMFDEYFKPPSVERLVSPAFVVQVLVVSAGTPFFYNN
nr:retrovirus-related Pol polyprotein from transposon TNT 1-94 [Tanacetum cinerariifolium]